MNFKAKKNDVLSCISSPDDPSEIVFPWDATYIEGDSLKATVSFQYGDQEFKCTVCPTKLFRTRRAALQAYLADLLTQLKEIKEKMNEVKKALEELEDQ